MARTLSLGLAVALGATLLAPAAPALASPVQTSGGVHAADLIGCPAELTEAELNDLLADVDTATQAKTAEGFRYVVSFSSDFSGDEDLDQLGLIVTKDARHHRLETNLTIGTDELRLRSLENGFMYLRVSDRNKDDRPGLRILHRSNAWVNVGRVEESDDMDDVVELGDVDGGGTCESSESGLTITFTEDDVVNTITTDASLAITAISAAVDETTVGLLTLTYGANTVAYIDPKNRITSATWIHALVSAERRAALTSYAKKIGTNAKAIAKQADRRVMARDVQKAAKATPLPGTVRTVIKTGVTVTAKTKDPYSRKVMRISIRSVDHVIKINDTW